jgi:hypothetical protein
VKTQSQLKKLIKGAADFLFSDLQTQQRPFIEYATANTQYLYGFRIPFPCPYADNLINRGDENFTITDFTSPGCRDNFIHNHINLGIFNDNFHLEFLEKLYSRQHPH